MYYISKVITGVLKSIAYIILKEELSILRSTLTKQEETVDNLLKHPVGRLTITEEVFKTTVLDKLPKPCVTRNTTELEAASLLGQQQVINLLRENFVVK